MAPNNARYKKLGSDSDSDLVLLSSQPMSPRCRKIHLWTIILALFTAVLSFLSLYLCLLLKDANTQLAAALTNTCASSGYNTDWEPAKVSVQMQEVKYSGAFRYNETSKTFYREVDPAMPQYAGAPGPEIDKAWNDLLGGQYLVVSDVEAKAFDEISKLNGYYIAEVDAMHSLHCLNAIRKEVDWEHYGNSRHAKYLSAEARRIHVDHCIDQIRQHIQCAVDLTPVPLVVYGEPDDIQLIGTPQVHTCRNWDAFREWWTERGTTIGSLNGTSDGTGTLKSA